MSELTTDELRSKVMRARQKIRTASDEAQILRKQLAPLDKYLREARVELHALEAELRGREPERGGRYMHESGVFEFESYYGEKRWFYRIMGTDAEVHEVSLPNYGACYEIRIKGQDLGLRAGPFQIGIVRALWDAWREWSKIYRGVDPGPDHLAVKKWREERGLNV